MCYDPPQFFSSPSFTVTPSIPAPSATQPTVAPAARPATPVAPAIRPPSPMQVDPANVPLPPTAEVTPAHALRDYPALLPLPYASHHLQYLHNLLADNPTPSTSSSLSVQSAPRSANPSKPCSMYPFPIALLVEPPSLWQPSVIASPAETRLDIHPRSPVSPPPAPDHRRMSVAPNPIEKTSRLLLAPTICGTSSRPTNGNLTNGVTIRTRGHHRPSRAQQLARRQPMHVRLT